MKKWIIPVSILTIIGLGIGYFVFQNYRAGSIKENNTQNSAPAAQSQSNDNNSATVSTQKTENKLCDWIDEYGIVIHLNFAEGVTKDTSYEAGFAYSSIGSDRRLARGACDYRTAFKPGEMKNKGAVQVVVRGYTDSRLRKLQGDPITVIFDSEGKPNVALPIEVTVLD